MNSHWSEYWKQGHLTSFGGSFSNNYQGVLKDCWNELFDSLPNDFNVLDIATGNGALALLARERCEGRTGHVIGIDYAEVMVEPETSSSSIGVELQSNINCEKLVFEDNSFDAVISQFGIEYSNLELSLIEASRVLKPKGSLRLIMHHSDSLIINRNRRTLNLVKAQEVDELLETMSNLVTAMGTVNDAKDLDRVKNDSECELLRSRLNNVIGKLVKLDEDALKDSELMTYVATVFKKGLFWPVEEKLRYLTFVSQEISTLKLRLEELIKASIDQAKLGLLIANLNKYALNLTGVNVLKSADNEIIAWSTEMQKL